MILICSIAAWLAVFAVTFPGAFRVVAGKGGDHDAVKLSYHLVSWVMLGFSFRWIFAQESMAALDVMRGLNTVLALFLVVIARFYRRG